MGELTLGNSDCDSRLLAPPPAVAPVPPQGVITNRFSICSVGQIKNSRALFIIFAAIEFTMTVFLFAFNHNNTKLNFYVHVFIVSNILGFE